MRQLNTVGISVERHLAIVAEKGGEIK
jgi:hypothetical protein